MLVLIIDVLFHPIKIYAAFIQVAFIFLDDSTPDDIYKCCIPMPIENTFPMCMNVKYTIHLNRLSFYKVCIRS